MIRKNAAVRGTIAALIVAAVTAATAQEILPRLSQRDPRVKILRYVQPEAVDGVYANSVTVDVVVSLEGSVESVTVVEGHKAHRASAVAALKEYRFAPVVIEGKITRVIVRVVVHVPDRFSSDALAKNARATSATSVAAARDVVLLADCSRSLTTQDGSDQAIQTCRDAIVAADQAGSDAFNRRSPRKFLGDVYMFGQRWSDALAAYESALSIAGPSDDADLGVGEILITMALAQVNLGNLASADRNAEAAAKVISASMNKYPDQRPEHLRTLRQTLVFHARIKRLQGDTAAATTLESKAASLASSK